MDLRIKYVDPHAKIFWLFSILRFCDDPDPNDPNEKTKRKNEEKILKDTFGEEGKEIFFAKSSQLEAENCPTGQDRYFFNPKKTCKQNFELIPNDGEFVKKQQCKKATRVCKLTVFPHIVSALE